MRSLQPSIWILGPLTLLVAAASALGQPESTDPATPPASPPATEAERDSGALERFPAEWHWASNDEQLQACYAMVGKKTPKLSTHGWLNSTPTHEEMKNKIIVVDFWATWCRPCIAAIPKNNDLMDRYAGEGVRVIGVCGSKGAENMSFIVKKHDMRYPTTRDVYNQTAQGWGVQWWPYYVILDRNGVVRGAGIHPNHVEDAVKALLAEQPAEAAGDSGEPEHDHDADDAHDHDHAHEDTSSDGEPSR